VATAAVVVVVVVVVTVVTVVVVVAREVPGLVAVLVFVAGRLVVLASTYNGWPSAEETDPILTIASQMAIAPAANNASSASVLLRIH
jgi:hypothetical protein